MRSRLALLLLLPAAAFADVEMLYSDGTVGLISDGRVVFGDDSDTILIVPGDEGFIVISHDDRTWMRLEPGFINDMAAEVQAQMDAMLAGMPPEQRAMVEAQMQGMMPQMPSEMPPMELKRTGGRSQVAGYDCEEAEVSYGGAIEETVCIATADELGISDADFDALAAAMQGMAEMASLDGGKSTQADFAELGGVPIRTSAGAPGSQGSELVSLDTGELDPARLRVPDGYREISMQDMMGR